MSTFGFYPGPIDYWMLVTDWRNGSIAIMLAIGALIVGYAFRTGSPPPTAVLPTHASPAVERALLRARYHGPRPLPAVFLAADSEATADRGILSLSVCAYRDAFTPVGVSREGYG
jgi:hypothetical protein